MRDNTRVFRTREELEQEREDVLFRLAFRRIQDDKALRLTQEANIEAQETVPAQLRLKALRVIDRAVSRQDARCFFAHTLPRAGRIAAICLLALFIGLATAFAAVEPFRAKVMELLFTDYEERTEVRLRESEDVSLDVPEDWMGEYWPTAIPNGCEHIVVYPGYSQSSADFLNFDGLPMFSFTEMDDDTVTSIDTENANVENILIHNQKALCVTKEQRVTIVWREGIKYFLLEYRGETQTAVALAESVVRIK